MVQSESIRTKEFVVNANPQSESLGTAGFSLAAASESNSDIFVFPLAKSESILTEFSITGVFYVDIISAAQIDWSDYVKITFQILDFQAPSSIELVYCQYSLDNVSWNNCTLEPTHPNNDTTFPFTSSVGLTTHNIVWNAIGDLGEGEYSVWVRLRLRRGLTESEDIIRIDYIIKFYGMGYFPPEPLNLRVFNVDDDPIPKAELSWDLVTNADLHNNYFKMNHWFSRTNDGRRITLHQRQVQGYSLYRSTILNFNPPAEGIELANSSVLTATTSQYTDTSVSQGVAYHYKIATVIGY